MKKRTAKRLEPLLLVLSLISAGLSFGATPPGKSPYTFEVNSAVKDLVVQTGDGATGVARKMLSGRPGLNEITVSAPGFASRKLHIWLEEDKPYRVNVDLAPVTGPALEKWTKPFKKFDPGKLEKKASVCIGYQAKASDKGYCDRQTLLDDIFFVDDSIYISADLKTYEKSKELDAFRGLLARIGDEQATPAIEEFYTRHGSELSAFHLLSLHSLLIGDCPRVNTVFLDAGQSFNRVTDLRFHMALCAEANNDPALRDKIMNEGMGKDKSIDPALAYWAFALALPSSPQKALELAKGCANAARGADYRCQEALWMGYKLAQKPFKFPSFNREEEAFRTLLSIEEKLPKGLDAELYESIAGEIESSPYTLEYYVFLNWVNAARKREWAHDFYQDHKIRIAVAMASSNVLEKAIDSIEKQDLSQLLPPVYLRRLRTDPQDPNLWIRLIRAYSKAKQCKELLLAIEQGGAYLPKYNANLLQMRGGCEVELGKNKEALSTYSKIQEISPNNWTSPYNLANVLERLGKKAEALVDFRKALELKPPADAAAAIQSHINQLEGGAKASK